LTFEVLRMASLGFLGVLEEASRGMGPEDAAVVEDVKLALLELSSPRVTHAPEPVEGPASPRLERISPVKLATSFEAASRAEGGR
jgi:hypothetical protein